MIDSRSNSKVKRILIMFDFIGPYHEARLRNISREFEIVALECSSVSRDSKWLPTGDSNIRKLTLFPEGDITQCGESELVNRLTRILTQQQPDVLVVAGWADRVSLRGLQWSVSNRVPTVMMSESQRDDAPRTRITEWVKRHILKGCSTALVGGKTHQDYLEELGIARDSIHLGYDIVDNDYFTNASDQIRKGNEQNSGSLGLPKRFFLASSRFVEKKNLSRLLEAYALYRDTAMVEAWDLVLLGDGELRAAVEHKISVLGLGDNVHLKGFVQYPEIPSYYATASAFIHASTVEQWGLVVNEAMASRVPVLVSDRCGSARELIQPNINGILFDPFEVRSICDSMLTMSRLSQSERDEMASQGYKTIQSWGPERFQRGLEEACRQALERKPVRVRALSRIVLALYCRIAG